MLKTEKAADKLVAEWMSALSDATRIAIIRKLFAGPMSVTDLAKQVGMEVVNISHHLSVLKNANVVQDEKKGRFVFYTLKSNTFESVDGHKVVIHPNTKTRVEFTAG